jgi:hypothetical protein
MDELLRERDALVAHFRRDGGDRDLVLQADLAQVGGGGCDGDDAQAVEKHVFAQHPTVVIDLPDVEIHLLRDVVYVVKRIDVRETFLNGYFRFARHLTP